jgi:putative hydrolase
MLLAVGYLLYLISTPPCPCGRFSVFLCLRSKAMNARMKKVANNLRLLIDTHVHTCASGHAYSTIQENAREAKSKGMAMIAITDHAPAMCGAPTEVYFNNLKTVPSQIAGVGLIKGAEVNIIDYEGQLDLPEQTLRRLELVIVSLHDLCIAPATLQEHTAALVRVLQNPLVDAVAHPGNPQYQVDIGAVVAAAAKYHKLIEMNNHSFTVRTGSEPNCREFAARCKAAGVRMICGSDAHFSTKIGDFDHVNRIFKEVDMPEELVLNASVERFKSYLAERELRVG